MDPPVATLTVGENTPSELVHTAMTRARFCELLAGRVPHGESDLFLMGLLSMIDAILEMPMVSILGNVPVDHETKAVATNRRKCAKTWAHRKRSRRSLLASHAVGAPADHRVALTSRASSWKSCNPNRFSGSRPRLPALLRRQAEN